MDTRDEQLSAWGGVNVAEDTQAAKKTLSSMLVASKNLTLYPQGNSICINSIQQLHSYIETYIHTYGDLRLEIEKDKIISRGEVIYSDLPEEGSLPFTLFRDGIRWIEFIEGIEPDEIQGLISIINKYKVLYAEPDGDIVTSLWEARFPHMRYEVAGFIDGAEQERDVRSSLAQMAKSNAPLREKTLEEKGSQTEPGIDPASMVITPQEEAKLREMVHLEENTDPTAYLDALLDSLLQYQDKGNFETILSVLSEEFSYALSRTEFAVSLKILQGVSHVFDVCKADMLWAGPCIEDFSYVVSGSDSLDPLKNLGKDLDSEQAGILRQVLVLLQPQAIAVIGPLLLQHLSPHARQALLDSISSLSSRDIGPLEALIDKADERLVEKLLPVIVKLDGERPLKFLKRMVRHPSARIRQEAIKGILQRGNAHMRDIFTLIDDKDESIRRMVLNEFGQFRNKTIEGLLITYLQNKTFTREQNEHLLLCFRTLGQCGSSRAVPFLRNELLRRGWIPSFWRDTYRKGAVAALVALGTKEALQVLHEADRWFYPGVKGIARKALRRTA
jgi:hypothetical protein